MKIHLAKFVILVILCVYLFVPVINAETEDNPSGECANHMAGIAFLNDEISHVFPVLVNVTERLAILTQLGREGFLEEDTAADFPVLVLFYQLVQQPEIGEKFTHGSLLTQFVKYCSVQREPLARSRVAERAAHFASRKGRPMGMLAPKAELRFKDRRFWEVLLAFFHEQELLTEMDGPAFTEFLEKLLAPVPDSLKELWRGEG